MTPWGKSVSNEVTDTLLGRARRPRFFVLILSALFLLACANSLHAGSIVRYEVKVPLKHPGMVQVRLILNPEGATSIPLILPEGTVSGRRTGSGSTRTVTDFQVTNAKGKAIPFERSGLRYWVVHTQGARTVHVSYIVSQLVVGQDRAQAVWFQPADSLVYWKDSTPDPVRIRYFLPKGWKPATDLKPIASSHTFEAPSLAALLDSPALLGRLQRTDFKVRGILFSLVTCDRPRFDTHALTVRLKKMIQYQLDLFGMKPFDRYVFFLLDREDRSASFDEAHRSCSVYALPTHTLDFCGHGPKYKNQPYMQFARNLFCAWNTYYIHPLQRGESVLAQPSRSRAKWFTSGVSEYYALRTLFMTGLIDTDTFFNRIGHHLAGVESRQDYGQTSVAQASWDHVAGENPTCWRTPGLTSNGFLIGLLLDLEIRRVSRGQKNLDEVMKFLGWWFGKKNTGYDDNVDLEKAVSTVAEHDFSEFFRNHVEGPARLPVDSVLAEAGYDVERKDRGHPSRFLFIRHLSHAGFQPRSGRLTSVQDTNCLFNAGLRTGDRLATVNGVSIRDHKDLDTLSRALFAAWRSNSRDDRTVDHLSVTYRRNNKLLKAEVKLPTYGQKTTSITPSTGRKNARPAHLKDWLEPRWPPDGPPRPPRLPMGGGGTKRQ